MIELMVGAIVLGVIILTFKVLFLILGLLFSGLGFFIRIAFLGALGFLFFPAVAAIIGGVLSSGFIAILFAGAFLAVIFGGSKRHYRDRNRDEDRYYRSGYSRSSREW